ncbi:MAG: undecaprenyldiphospho-muramoylpentapeptide beta-N-acetylglucosaminyltransferase [Pseudomonadota bacterium]
MSETFVIMAGGTGGHVFPGLAVADELTAAGYRVEWLGTQAGIESRLVPDAGYTLHCLPVSGVRGLGVVTLLKAPLMITRSVYNAWKLLRKLRPVAVMGFGGFAAGPGAVAARLLGKPLILHEQNSVLGTTNGLLQYVASRRLEGFPNTFTRRRNTYLTGNPVRADIAAMPADKQHSHEGSLNILVVGGSRGARALNENLPLLLKQASRNSATAVSVCHQSGEQELASTRERYEALDCDLQFEVCAFLDNMAERYNWADIVVCRAGAMTVAELTAAGKPSLLVPFPYAIDDHQTENARWLADHSAGVLVPQSELLNETTIARLAALLESPQKRSAMAECAKQLAILDSASRVAQHCTELTQSGSVS